MAERYLTHVPFRNGEWQGHAWKRNVRNVIRCSGHRDLRIFVLVDHMRLVDEDGDHLEGTAYMEIYRPAWDTYFAED